MYAWIWRHLPFGLAGKIVGTLVLVSGVMALLWFVVFPAAEPLLPFGDVQVTDNSGNPGGGGDQVVPTESVPPDGVIPYGTDGPAARTSRR